MPTVAQEHAVVNCFPGDNSLCASQLQGCLVTHTTDALLFTQPCITIMPPAIANFNCGQHASLAGTVWVNPCLNFGQCIGNCPKPLSPSPDRTARLGIRRCIQDVHAPNNVPAASYKPSASSTKQTTTLAPAKTGHQQTPAAGCGHVGQAKSAAASTLPSGQSLEGYCQKNAYVTAPKPQQGASTPAGAQVVIGSASENNHKSSMDHGLIAWEANHEEGS